MKRIGGNMNTSDEGHDMTPVACNSSTSTEIKAPTDVQTEVPPVSIKVYHDGNKILWVKTKNDTVKEGMPIMPGSDPVEIYDTGSMFTGALYGIYDSGPGGNVYVSWL